MRILFPALLGLATSFLISPPATAATLTWSANPQCSAQARGWTAPAHWRPLSPDLAVSMLGRLASPTSYWRFADQVLSRISHSPISGIALTATFEATNDFVVEGVGMAKPLYARAGCLRGFSVKAGKVTILAEESGLLNPVADDAPYVSLSLPRVPGPVWQVATGLPGLTSITDTGTPPTAPEDTENAEDTTDLPVILIMDEDDKKEPLILVMDSDDKGAPVTLIMDLDDKAGPFSDPQTPSASDPVVPDTTSLTPVPLPASAILLLAALGLLVAGGRRKA